MNYKHLISLVCILFNLSFAICAQSGPDLKGLKAISQVPSEYPQRISAIAYDGRKFWLPIYHGSGDFAVYDPVSDSWNAPEDIKQKDAIQKVSAIRVSAGGVVFADGKLWFGSAYGRSYGWIDQKEPGKSFVYNKDLHQDIGGSKSYADLTFDGEHIWVAWHAFNYKIDHSKTQLLLKIDRETGEVMSEFALPPGKSAHGSHGLTWDGSALWHIKDNILSKLDRQGVVIKQFDIPEIKGASGLAWDGKALWIAQFNGKIWRLPFRDLTASAQ